MIVLGISALYHDSAAAIVKDGQIVAASQEERFTRKKHDLSLPFNAIRFCLDKAHIVMSDVDKVVFYDNPFITLDRFLSNTAAIGERGKEYIELSFPSLLQNKLWVKDNLKKELGCLGKDDDLLFAEHHISHAASAFYPSPFESAAILTIDGVGGWSTTTIGKGTDNNIEILKQINYPDSLGLFYSAFTYYCGFKVNEGDYKFMGLAPYGEPVYYELIKDKFIHVYDDGSFKLNLDYYDYFRNDVMINSAFENVFGIPRRDPESKITKHYMDVAASVQKVTEEIIIKLAKTAKELTGLDNLCIAGGVGLNCVANGKLQKERIFNNIWIQPAAGDAGGALGCALYAAFTLYNADKRMPLKFFSPYLGPDFTNDTIKIFLDKKGYVYHEISEDKLFETVASYLNNQKVIGLFHGCMEFGPRALGNRSIIADPRSEKMQSKLNLKIKYRESFRPFAPSVLAECKNDYFDLDCDSPYMLMCADVIEDIRTQKSLDVGAELKKSDFDMLEVVNAKRSSISAVTHVDFSARIQTVEECQNPYYYKLIKAFKDLTGCGVVVNTSFNVRGEPIVCTPEDACRCFMRTEMDALVLENLVLLKEEQKQEEISDDWMQEFTLD